MKANKVSNESYSSSEVEKAQISDIKSFAASKQSFKLGTTFWDTWYMRIFYQNSRMDFNVSKDRGKVKYE